MSALRRPTGALKLLSLSWRQAVSPGISYHPLRPLNYCKYSSTPKQQEVQEPLSTTSTPDNKQEPSSNDVDPFGIGEVVNNAKNTVLVQGFYQNPADIPSHLQKQVEPPPPATAITQTPAPRKYSRAPKPYSAPPSSSPGNSLEDQIRHAKLSEYDGWLRQRAEQEMGEVESFREASFGQVRVDAENPIPRGRGGGREDPNYGRPPVFNERSSQRRPRRGASRADENDEPIIETIEADHSQRMRASDFLKQMQGQQGSRTEEGEDGQGQSINEMDHKEKLVISRIIGPRKVPSMDPNDPENYASAKDNTGALDTNIIPKPYLLPDYNQITDLDMWSVLSKSIIFQNDFILAISKPAGIPVHSKSRDCRHTVIQFMKKFADMVKCEKVYPLHRIDKETTGVLLFAKDKKMAEVLKEKFANRQIQKTYLGVTKLCPRYPEGTIHIPIGEGLIPGTNGKFRRVLRPDLREFGVKLTERTAVDAITNYKVLHSIREAAFVEIEPVTGCKHQIRVHFGMGLGCPLIGDHKYSHRDRLAPQRLHPFVLHKIKLKQSKVREIPLHLHCSKVSFTLPKEFTESTEPVHIQANIPYFMKYTLKRLSLIRR